MNKAIRAARREVPAIFWGLLALAGLLLLRRRVLWAALAAAAWAGVAAFFRDPERTPDRDDPRAILAPADGTVRKVERVEDAPWIGGPAQRITLFLSLLDVHVQRSPADGQVAWVEYRPGSFAPAYQEAADTNEANWVGIETAHGKLLVAQMAGVLARRIVCWTSPGARLARGQRFGLIRFGSRVDLYAPLEVTVTVAPGQQVYGGQTVVAVWPTANQSEGR